MAETVPFGRAAVHTPAVEEVHILWITAGLGCDGDSVSITAASEPSIEDVILGAIPGLPKVRLHNAVLSYEVGDDFMKALHQARGANSKTSCLWSKARSRTRSSAAMAIGRQLARMRRPASRSEPLNGSTD